MGIATSARGRWLLAPIVLLAAALLAACGGGSDAASSSAAGTAGAAGEQTLLSKQQLTALDQPLAYPKKGAAQVSSAVTTLQPGQETGWTRNNVPTFVYVLDGTLSVEYDAGVTKEYGAGSSYLEAQGVFHNGTNKGSDPVRLLTVSMGAKGTKNSVTRAS